MGYNNVQQSALESVETPDYKFIEVDFNQENSAFNIQLLSLDKFALFDFAEVDITFDPIGEDVSAKHYAFLPFEDYINDTKNNNSMYRHKEDIAKTISGVSVASIISGIAANFDPSDLTKTESQLALVTAYVGGRLIWPWVEARIMNMTNDHKLQFKENYYSYERKKSTTPGNYGDLAQRCRSSYTTEDGTGVANLKPDQMGVVIDSRSQRIRFRFNKKQFAESNLDEKINILKVKISKEYLEEFYQRGVAIGVHIKFAESKRFIPLAAQRVELIQTLLLTHGKVRVGCLGKSEKSNKIDMGKAFKDGYMEVRDTISFGRMKYYKSFETEKATIITYPKGDEGEIGKLHLKVNNKSSEVK